jgi:hypothetical protein
MKTRLIILSILIISIAILLISDMDGLLFIGNWFNALCE